MPATSRWALPYPSLSDIADVPADMQELAAALDDVAKDDQGLLANRPTSTAGSPGKKGRYWWATDVSQLYRDNGTGWDLVTTEAPIDPAPNIAGLRTLGTGPNQACAGNDPRLSDARTPLDNSVTLPKMHTTLKPSTGAGGGSEALRALGTNAGNAAAGIHAAQHLPGGADPLSLGFINLSGTRASKPAPSGANVGIYYYENDWQAVWRSNGGAWTRISTVPKRMTPATFLALSGMVDGDEVIIEADATNGVLWHFRYYAASGSAYKWEFVGGADLYVIDTTTDGINNATYTDAGDPSIAIPAPGDYDISWGFHLNGDVADTNCWGMGLSFNGGLPVAPFETSMGLNDGLMDLEVASSARKTGAAAGTVKAMYKKHYGENNATASHRWVRVTPVRVSD